MMSGAQRAEECIIANFKEFDKDGSGRMSGSAFQEVMKRLGLSGEDAKSLVDEFPCIQYAELVRWALNAEAGKDAHVSVAIPTPPPGLTLLTDVTQRMKDRQCEEPQKWCMPLHQWSMVIKHCQTLTDYQKLKQEKGFVNMYDICNMYVKPWTARTGCGLAVLMNKDTEESAKLMLSHAWGEDAEEMRVAVDKRCQSGGIASDTPIWFCVFGNYQPGDGFGPSIGDQLKMRPFERVIQSKELIHGMVAVHTTREDMYGRLWCVHEVDAALTENVQVTAAMSDKYVAESARRVELFLMEGCDYRTCLSAAGIFVNTCKARCGYAGDEQMLIEIIQGTEGGFKRLDDVVAEFRKARMPTKVAFYLDAALSMDSLEAACKDLKQLFQAESFSTEEFHKLKNAFLDARDACEQFAKSLGPHSPGPPRSGQPRRLETLLAMAQEMVRAVEVGAARAVDNVLEAKDKLNVLTRKACFTQQVERALDANEGSKTVLFEIQSMLKHVILRLREDCDVAEKTQLQCMLNTLMAQRDIVNEVFSAPDQETQRVMWEHEERTYEGKTGLLECRCNGFVVSIGCQLPKSMLCTTKLTREANALLVQAVAENRPFIACGAAGTGKTETAKGMFTVCLGIESIVLKGSSLQSPEGHAAYWSDTCCKNKAASKTLTADDYANYWAGLCKIAGASWPKSPLLIDEAQFLPEDSLRAAVVAAEAARVPLVLTGRADALDYLRSIADHGLAMMFYTPSCLDILKSTLASEGFLEYEELRVACGDLIQQCQSQLSKQMHYDWGMRWLKRVAVTAGKILRELESETETMCFAQCIFHNTFRRLVQADRQTFSRLLKEHLIDIQVPEAYSQPIGMIKDSLRHSYACMVTPLQPGEVEPTLCLLEEAATAMDATLLLVPSGLGGATPVDQYLASLEAMVRKATLLGKVWLTIVCSPPEGESTLNEYFEYMLTLTDGNHTLCLDNGERIPLTQESRVIFLMIGSLQDISPAMLSRLDVVCIESEAMLKAMV